MRIVIPGSPFDAAINVAYQPVVSQSKRGKATARLIKTKRGRAFESRGVACTRLAIAEDRQAAAMVQGAPALRVEITSYWKTLRHLDGVKGLGKGDVDAPIKATLDALALGGLFDDDVRVVELIARKGHDKDNPRIEVEIEPAVHRDEVD